jgi:urease accessory protein
MAPRRACAAVSWHGHLTLRYRRDGQRTLAHDAHDGPLRVLKALYPEGGGICHHVLVHPPGGIAGGDQLDIAVDVGDSAHALITSAGAARFYRSDDQPAGQRAQLRLQDNARLEWLPLEAIAFPGCRAANHVSFELATGAQSLGWDMLALGLPAADQAFTSGWTEQQLHWPGVWLERGRIVAHDLRLLDSPIGLNGQRALGTIWFASQAPWPAEQREALLGAARQAAAASPLAAGAGATSPDARLVVMRVLAPRIEPLFELLCAVRAAWRHAAWRCAAETPRVWRT